MKVLFNLFECNNFNRTSGYDQFQDKTDAFAFTNIWSLRIQIWLILIFKHTHTHTHTHTYIYIYIYMMAVLSVLIVTTSFISCPLPLPYSALKLYVFVGDSSGKPNCNIFCHRIGTTDQFCLEWHYLGARSILHIYADGFWTNQRLAQFSAYVTVSVVTLWTWCWTLFSFANQTFVSAVLHTAILKGFYVFVNQFTPVSSIWSHFFPVVPR